jgi:hypothetical protein
MPRIVGPGSSKLRLSIVALVLLFAFPLISRGLLNAVGGSFSPAPYSSLALKNYSDPAAPFEVGDLVPVLLTNHTGSTKTYHWNASQHGVVISLGETTLSNGTGATIDIPTSLGRSGRLRIGISGTDVFVTVPLQPS